ncbi:MAG: ATP-binding protein [Granulosicoccaceae bacterium]
MRWLSISLSLLLLVGIIFAGWGIDRLFTHFYPSEENSLQVAKSVGAKLAQALDTVEPKGFLDDAVRIMQYEELALPAELQSRLEQGQSITLETDSGINLYFNQPNTKQVLNLSVPYQDDSGTPIRLILTMLFYVCVILLVMAWLYPLIRRLRALETTAKAFGEGELDRRVSTHTRSQLHSIETEFNNMASRIDGLVGDNKLLSSAVSHDLRTPLARLRFGVDALHEMAKDESQTDYLHRLSNDVTEMEQLVSVLLEFAKLDKELHDLPLSEVNLTSIVEHAVQTARDLSDHTITFDTDQNKSFVLANDRYATIMLNNLLQNAIRYGKSAISVRLVNQRQHSILYIDDDGPGIPISARKNVLKPFIRNTVDQGKHGSRNGYGLGLAIVSRIAEWHQAELQIEDSSALGGASIKVVLSKNKSY